MKKIIIFSTVCCAVLTGCSSKELTREEAFKLLQESKHYPQLVDYDVYCGDPEQARKVIKTGLETSGILTVKRTQKLGEVGSPLISFTDKATAFLLPTSADDQASNIQKVKVANEELIEVTGIKTGSSGKEAIVNYTTTYKNITPFSVLVPIDFKKQPSRHANFILYDNGWRLEN